MKKLVTLIIIAFLVCNVSVAQNTIAKLKFEEAEEAYTNNNFELTLSKIKEVETLVKTTSPKILYLKIKAQNSIIEKNPEKEYAIIESTRTIVYKYLKDYDNLPDNEDKYREIYKISEKLFIYPKNKTEFDNIALKKINDEIEAIDIIKKKSKRICDSILNVSNFKLFITKDEFIKLYPESQPVFSGERNKISNGFYKYTNKKDYNSQGLQTIYLNKNIVDSYSYLIKYYTDNVEGKVFFNELAKYFDDNLVLVTIKSSGERTYKIKKEDKYDITLYYSPYDFLYINY